MVLTASERPFPEAVEIRTGVFVLKGGATPALYPALKRQHITHVLDLRNDGEIAPESAFRSTVLQEMNIQYMRYATGRIPPAVDLDFIRTLLQGLPKGARLVVTCNNGNRAAAALCPWLVLDQGMPLEEAMAASQRAGLRIPETEAAIRGYLLSHSKL
jgi:rhodanese-related sulfurtransferase